MLSKSNIFLFAVTLFFYEIQAQSIEKITFYLDDLTEPLEEYIIDDESSVDEIFALNLDGVSSGYHRIYAVVHDANNSFSHMSQSVVLVEGVTGMETLTELEYYFDEDPGIGNADQLNVSPDEFWNEQLEIEATGLSGGRHNLYLRVKNAVGEWSQSIEKIVLVEGTVGFEYLDQAEYYFDEDPGIGNATQLSINPDIFWNQQLEIDAVDLSGGRHNLYLRVRNAVGDWSQSNRKVVLVEGNLGLENLNQLEYFFDNDPGFGLATTVDLNEEPSVDEQYPFEIDEALPLGDHILYIRVQDGGGQWNHYMNLPVFVCSQEVPLITQDGNTLICNQIALSYQWFLNGQELEGATSQELEAEESGNYTVYVDSGDCYNTSEVYDFTYVSILELNELNVAMYPNPAKNILNITANYVFDVIYIYDSRGVKVRSIAISSNNQHYISINDLSSGIYFVEIAGELFNHREKVLIGD